MKHIELVRWYLQNCQSYNEGDSSVNKNQYVVNVVIRNKHYVHNKLHIKLLNRIHGTCEIYYAYIKY